MGKGKIGLISFALSMSVSVPTYSRMLNSAPSREGNSRSCLEACNDPMFSKRRTQMIRLKRVYEPAIPEDVTRFLIERLWLREVKKAPLRLDAWVKQVAPSASPRR